MNKRQLFYLVARILSLDFHNNKIINDMPKDKNLWQQWVQTASNHLILPSLFLSLQRNQLLQRLPSDLSEYLEYVYDLNLERNKKIAYQTQVINNLLGKEGIKTIIMKGMGNIGDGLYNDLGERMLYDIDLLVEDDNMIPAADILMKEGYKTQKPFNIKSYPSTMHFPILVKEGCVSGVEIHRIPVHNNYLKYLSAEQIFSDKKVTSTNFVGFSVMSDKHKIIHNFIHSQLMHNGHYHANVSLRDLYDLLLLSRREIPADIFNNKDKAFRKKAYLYLLLMYRVFDLEIPTVLKDVKGKQFFLRHSITIKMDRKSKIAYLLMISVLQKYFLLPLKTLWDSNARNYVFSRLADKSWYKRHYYAYKRKFSGKKKI